MPAPSEEGHQAPDLLCIVDASVLINIKRQLPQKELWPLFQQMDLLVEQGRLSFPRQVEREIARWRFPDIALSWCAHAVSHRRVPDPTDADLAAVGWAVADLVQVDADPDSEVADPYIVAMAHRLGGDIDGTRGPLFDVVVATDDFKDRRPLKVALTTACERLGIPCWRMADFVDWVRHTQPHGDVEPSTDATGEPPAHS